jgi:hypothetical protein
MIDMIRESKEGNDDNANDGEFLLLIFETHVIFQINEKSIFR